MPNQCPQCTLENVYFDSTLWICADCGFEFTGEAAPVVDALLVKDAHGNVLQDGDSVVLVKDLKVRNAAVTLKIGTKIRNIRIKPDAGDHNVDCKVDGVGFMLKSEFLKKA